MKIENCRAIVTGGSSGIGLATVQALVRGGASHVGILSRHPDVVKLHEAAQEFGIHKLIADVCMSSEVGGAFKQFVDRADGIDVLVNCAGVLDDGAVWTPTTKYAIDAWDRIIDTNLRGAFLCSQLAVEYMLRRRIRGVIVNMSSVSRRGRAGQVAYSASKGGISSMTAAMAREFAAYRIRCVAIAPGLIDTPMAAQVPETYREEIRRATPVRRLGKSDEIAATVVHVIENDFINGCTIDVDGGFAG